MSTPSKGQILLEEWNTCESAIRNLDNILTQIRFYGFTVTIALMGAAGKSPNKALFLNLQRNLDQNAVKSSVDFLSKKGV